MGRVTIAPVTRADIPLVHGLMHGLAVYEKIEHEFVSSPADLERALFGERPMAEAIVGSLDGKPVGFALVYPTYSTFSGKPGLWLEDLFVLPEARGAGVGNALLARLAALAVERGCGSLQWEVLDWNEPAIGFYKSLGAEPLDEWTTFKVAGDALARLAAK
jgi:GNAT superfamily N-acetyltransferase